MKCFYHSSDLDGHCSGAIVKHRFTECEMFPINYGDKFPWEIISRDETIYIVDFALQPFSDMIKLNSLCNLVWIDHHITAINSYLENDVEIDGYRIDGQAACELTWDYIFGTERPLVITLLGRYDVWDHSDERVLPFQYGLRLKDTLPTDKSMKMWASLFIDNSLMATIYKGEAILEYEKQTNEKFVKSFSFPTSYEGLSAICINKGFTNSKVFDSIWDEKLYDLMITFCRGRNNKWFVSLYSTKENINCGELAKIFGGGGHKGAAGFQCNVLPFEY